MIAAQVAMTGAHVAGDLGAGAAREGQGGQDRH